MLNWSRKCYQTESKTYCRNAYVTNRSISEGSKLISDVLEMADILNMRGYLWKIDIEKTFDSVDHYWLLAILKKYWFKKTF